MFVCSLMFYMNAIDVDMCFHMSMHVFNISLYGPIDNISEGPLRGHGVKSGCSRGTRSDEGNS